MHPLRISIHDCLGKGDGMKRRLRWLVVPFTRPCIYNTCMINREMGKQKHLEGGKLCNRNFKHSICQIVMIIEWSISLYASITFLLFWNKNQPRAHDVCSECSHQSKQGHELVRYNHIGYNVTTTSFARFIACMYVQGTPPPPRLLPKQIKTPERGKDTLLDNTEFSRH